MNKFITGAMAFIIASAPLTSSVLAIYNNETPVSSVNSITVSTTSNPKEVSWTVNGTLQQGVKVVWSKNANPEYPNRSGDKYFYITDGSTTQKLYPFDGDGTYHVRVCEYLSGKCGTYSNDITIQLVSGVVNDDTKEKCQFQDVDADNSQCIYLRTAKKNNIVADNTNFYPEAYITRGQFAKMIVHAFRIPINTANAEGFSDVDSSNTFYGEILTLQSLGIINGLGGKYMPDAPVTRGAAVKYVINTLDALDIIDSSKFDNLDLAKVFKDSGIENHTFRKELRRLYAWSQGQSEPVINGFEDGYFRPDEKITRLGVIKIIIKTLKVANIIDNYDGSYTEPEDDNTDDDNTGDLTSISLTNDGAEVEWDANGNSAQGFKVVYSKTSNPVYPTRSTDKYQYFSDPGTDSATIDAFDGSGTYYVRVCEYLGGACGVYSNQITVAL